MINPVILAILSISSMMSVSCGTPRLESQAPLTIQPEDDCVWTDTPEDVLTGYEWTGIVTGDYISSETDLYLHCHTGSHQY